MKDRIAVRRVIRASTTLRNATLLYLAMESGRSYHVVQDGDTTRVYRYGGELMATFPSDLAGKAYREYVESFPAMFRLYAQTKK